VLPTFASTRQGIELLVAHQYGYSFPGVDDVTDMTDMQFAFLFKAHVEKLDLETPEIE